MAWEHNWLSHLFDNSISFETLVLRNIVLCLSLFLNNDFGLAWIISGLLVFLGILMILMRIGMIPLLRRYSAMLPLLLMGLLMLRGSAIYVRFIMLLGRVSLAMADETWGQRAESDMITAVQCQRKDRLLKVSTTPAPEGMMKKDGKW
jgi:hypothetical protein